MAVFTDLEQTLHIMLEHYQANILEPATAGLEPYSLPMEYILPLQPISAMTPTVCTQVLQDSIKIICMPVYRETQTKYIQRS